MTVYRANLTGLFILGGLYLAGIALMACWVLLVLGCWAALQTAATAWWLARLAMWKLWTR